MLTQDLGFGMRSCRPCSVGDDGRQLLRRSGLFPRFVLKRNGSHGVFAGSWTNCDRIDSLTGPDEELGRLARPRPRMTIRRDDVERHTLDLEFDEERGTDVGDPPELHLAWPDLHHGG